MFELILDCSLYAALAATIFSGLMALYHIVTLLGSCWFHMSHTLLRFNYAVEIGAHLAYRGHYRRTGDISIRAIAREELKHRAYLRRILRDHNKRPSRIFNFIFKVIGSVIGGLCQISPVFLLDFVAQTMELFAVVNYRILLIRYPEYEMTFQEIIRSENNHKKYFSRRWE